MSVRFDIPRHCDIAMTADGKNGRYRGRGGPLGFTPQAERRRRDIGSSLDHSQSVAWPVELFLHSVLWEWYKKRLLTRSCKLQHTSSSFVRRWCWRGSVRFRSGFSWVSSFALSFIRPLSIFWKKETCG